MNGVVVASSTKPRRLRRLAVLAGVRRRFAPHQLRHAHAVEMAREGVPLNAIQRQLGHANLGVTSICLQASAACAELFVHMGRDRVARFARDASAADGPNSTGIRSPRLDPLG